MTASRVPPICAGDNDSDEAPDRSLNVLLSVILVAALIARLTLLFSTHRTAEDFYITLRYAENIAHGHGFVYNLGHHVLGTTTPLYTLFLALAEAAGLNATLCGQLLNIAADSFSSWLLYRLARATIPDRGRALGIIAASILAVWPPTLYWAISGMETGLVTMCGLAVFVSLAERRSYGVAVWSALLVLLRIDGLLLVAIAFAELWYLNHRQGVSSRPAVARAVLLLIALLAPWTVFAFIYFGSPIPTSLVAKLHVYAWQNPALLPNLDSFARGMTRNALYYLLLAGAIPGIFVGWRHKRLRPALLWMMLYYAGMAFSKSFLFGWYYVPPVPLYILAAVIGWGWIVGSFGRGAPPGPPKARGGWGSAVLSVGGWPSVAAVFILIAGTALLPRQRALIAADQRQDEALLKSMGLMLQDVIQPGETLMLEPIGWIGYYSKAKILDAVGLVSPEIIPFFRPGSHSPYLDIMAKLKPDYVLLRTGEYADAVNAAVPPDRTLLENYILVREIPNPDLPDSPPAFYLLKRISR